VRTIAASPARISASAIAPIRIRTFTVLPWRSIVSAASGRGDGAAVVGGLLTGVLVSGFAFPLFLDFYESDARGAWTLPSLLHVSYGTVVFAVVVVALCGFAVAECVEARS